MKLTFKSQLEDFVCESFKTGEMSCRQIAIAACYKFNKRVGPKRVSNILCDKGLREKGCKWRPKKWGQYSAEIRGEAEYVDIPHGFIKNVLCKKAESQ